MVFWGTTIYLDIPHIVLGLDQLFWTGISFLKHVDGQHKQLPQNLREIDMRPGGALEYHESNLIQVLSKHSKTHVFLGWQNLIPSFFREEICHIFHVSTAGFSLKKTHAHKASNYAFAETSSSSSADEKVGLGSRPSKITYTPSKIEWDFRQ